MCITTYNISPETFIESIPCQISWQYNEQRYVTENNHLLVDLVDEWLKFEGQIKINNNKIGIIPLVIKQFKFFKDEMKLLETHPDPIERAKYDKVKYNCYKVIINSIYGALGQWNGSLFNVFNAATVTH